MSYLDEDFLKLKRREKYAKYSTLETGIYIKDELVEFEPRDIPELNINASLPKTVNFTFSVYPQDVPLDQVKRVAEQMKAMLKKVNPANIFYDLQAEVAENRALCWFNYKSYAIDDQIYTIMYLLAAEKGKILHGTFSCRFDSMNEWNRAAIQVIQSVKVMDT